VGHVPRRRGQEERALLPPLGARRRGDEVSAPRRLRLIGFLGSSGCGNWPSPFFFCFWRFRFHRRHFWKKNLGFISLAGGGARVLCGCDFTQTGHTLNIFASFLIFSKFFRHFIVNIMGIFVHGRWSRRKWSFYHFLLKSKDFCSTWKAKTFVQLTPWFSASSDDNWLLWASMLWIWAVHMQIAKCDEHLFRVLITKEECFTRHLMPLANLCRALLRLLLSSSLAKVRIKTRRAIHVEYINVSVLARIHRTAWGWIEVAH